MNLTCRPIAGGGRLDLKSLNCKSILTQRLARPTLNVLGPGVPAMTVFEGRDTPLSELTGHQCAWRGCEAAFEGDEAPEGWAWLILYHSMQPYLEFLEIPPTDLLRDAVLCPEHTKRLDEQMKDMGREISGPIAGNV